MLISMLMLLWGREHYWCRDVHRDGYSRRLSSFRFRFPHMLRMPENVQVADGPEPARARGMRQNLVYLSVLSQHHANEVQSIESPEEGARLLRFNPTSDWAEETILLFASRSYRFTLMLLHERTLLKFGETWHLFAVQRCERLKVTFVFKLSAFHNCKKKWFERYSVENLWSFVCYHFPM